MCQVLKLLTKEENFEVHRLGRPVEKSNGPWANTISP